jgi:hypothetical protein
MEFPGRALGALQFGVCADVHTKIYEGEMEGGPPGMCPKEGHPTKARM